MTRTNEEIVRECWTSITSGNYPPSYQYHTILTALTTATAERDQEIARLRCALEEDRRKCLSIAEKWQKSDGPMRSTFHNGATAFVMWADQIDQALRRNGGWHE